MISDEVRRLEERFRLLDGLLGEVLATLSLPANQTHNIGEMDFMVRRWQSFHERLSIQPEGAD